MSNAAHNLNSSFLLQNIETMSFDFDGITMDDLKSLWSTIQLKFSSEAPADLKRHMELVIANENDAQYDMTLIDFIKSCCQYKPVSFEEYVAFSMIASSVELLSITAAPLFRMEKFRLMAHTFNTFCDHWSHDEEQVSIDCHICIQSNDIQ